MNISISSLKRAAFVVASLWFATGYAEAGVILNAPDSIGFYDGNTYNPEIIGPGNPVIAPMFSAALPEVNGFAGQKVWGTATLEDADFGPYILGVASGTGSGTLLADTNFYVKYLFDSPNIPDFNWFIDAGIQTSAGYFYATFSFPSSVVGHTVQGEYVLGKDGFESLVPAGSEVLAWYITVGLGQFGTPPGSGPITLHIPQNSIDLVAVNVGTTLDPGDLQSAVPEPATWLMAAGGVALVGIGKIIARRKF